MYLPNKYENKELEKNVIGSLIFDCESIFKVIDILKVECFSTYEYSVIFTNLLELVSERKKIDYISLITKLQHKGLINDKSVINPFFITTLTERISVVNSSKLEQNCMALVELSIVRKIIKNSQNILYSIENNTFSSFDEIINQYQKNSNLLDEIVFKKEPEHISKISEKHYKEVEKAAANNGKNSGVPTGIKTLDKHTNGWQKSDLIIIAARPAMGKTSLLLNMAKNAANQNNPVLIFSLEMSSTQLVSRVETSSFNKMDMQKLNSGLLTENEWTEYDYIRKELKELPVFFDDSSNITLTELIAKTRKMIITQGIKIVFIDYLQLMSAEKSSYKDSRESEISTLSRGLKAIAKDFNIPIVAFSQLNRDLEKRAGEKRPQLSDLRESGAIEQDADIVLFIHRPEKYDIPVIKTKDGDIDSAGLGTLILAKHRNGSTGDVIVRFNEQKMLFTDYYDFDENEKMEDFLKSDGLNDFENPF